jgi:hypothetical protein
MSPPSERMHSARSAYIREPDVLGYHAALPTRVGTDAFLRPAEQSEAAPKKQLSTRVSNHSIPQRRH